MKKLKIFAIVAAAAALALAAHKSGILHPEMAVQQGSYDKPLASIGTKPAVAWTDTTIASGVNRKPLPGKITTVVGEVLDLSCYLQLGKHGEAHRACGQKCVQNGQPIGLLAKDGTVYMVMPEEHDPRRDGGVDARASASEYMGRIVSVTGTETMVNGYRALYVQGLKR
ncbi:MAG: hypothetical protein M1436_09375 [Acidobacteria bacterium]|nr:hypothetical protein [Acidobacteriota bacterium]